MIFTGQIVTEQKRRVSVIARSGPLAPAEAARVAEELRVYLGWSDVKYGRTA